MLPVPKSLPMRKPLILVLLLAAASCRDPRAEANIAQAMMEVGTSISTMQQDYGMLQTQLDSLREVVARQDTLISRLASHVGMPIGPR
jgi:hypothetical protein